MLIRTTVCTCYKIITITVCSHFHPSAMFFLPIILRDYWVGHNFNFHLHFATCTLPSHHQLPHTTLVVPHTGPLDGSKFVLFDICFVWLEVTVSGDQWLETKIHMDTIRSVIALAYASFTLFLCICHKITLRLVTKLSLILGLAITGTIMFCNLFYIHTASKDKVSLGME
jgi:hypothetical protein